MRGSLVEVPPEILEWLESEVFAARQFALPASTDLSRQRRFAWSIAAALFAGSVINYLDRATLGVVMPQIRRDLGLTNQEYGWAVDSFLVAYMISYIVGGRLADRLGCRRMVSLTVAFRFVAGIAHALLTAPLVARVTLRYGWRASFPVTGGVGFPLLPPWLNLHRRIRAACFVPDHRLRAAIVAAALFGRQSWSSNIHTAISEISPLAHVAVLYGITRAAGTLMEALAQLVIGPVVDLAGYESVFVGAGLMYVAAACPLLTAGRIAAITPKPGTVHSIPNSRRAENGD